MPGDNASANRHAELRAHIRAVLHKLSTPTCPSDSVPAARRSQLSAADGLVAREASGSEKTKMNRKYWVSLILEAERLKDTVNIADLRESLAVYVDLS
jgi:hypothetical protein